MDQPPAEGDVEANENALESAKAGAHVDVPKSSKKRKDAPEEAGEDKDKDKEDDPDTPAAKRQKTGSEKAVANRGATSQKSKSPKSASKKKADAPKPTRRSDRIHQKDIQEDKED